MSIKPTMPVNPEIEVVKAGKTGLFTNYIFKAIPLAFDESMSYYETLCGLLNYLKNTIIPTVNNNANAVAELQSLYEQLKTYVDDYFTNLDVQEEINNKLDAMVEDGSLTLLIKKYVDPLIEVIDNKINQIASGSPIPVASTSQMTDTSRIYLNTTDGNWYWYNGTTWIIGGVYQASQIGNEAIEGNNIKNNTISPYSLIGIPYQEMKKPFKFAKWVRGYRYYQGELTPADGFISTITKYPVTPGATYTYIGENPMESPERIVSYKQDGSFNNEGIITNWTPSDCYYVALTLKEENFDPECIVSSIGKEYLDIPWLNLSNNIINKNIAVYGDSLWANCNGNFNYTDTPYNQSTDPCYGYKQYLEELGLTIDNYAVSGSTVKDCANHTGTNFPTNITTTHAEEYDAMIISFGRNDSRTALEIGTINDTGTDTFIGAMKYIIETMLSKNPKLKIFLWSMTQSNAGGWGPDNVNSKGYKQIDYVNALYTVADKYSCTVVDMYRESGINMKNIETFTFEGVHLTNDGYKFTAPFYKNKMKNNL